MEQVNHVLYDLFHPEMSEDFPLAVQKQEPFGVREMTDILLIYVPRFH